MPRGAHVVKLCASAAVLAALGCARMGYELLPEASVDPLPDDTNVPRGGGLGGSGLGGSGLDDAGAAGGGSSGGGGAASSGSGGAGSSTDAGDGGGADGGVSNGGTGGGTLAGCAPAAPAATWSFASDAQGWQIEADPGASGTLSWTAATGDPAGSLQIDATVANGFSNVRVYLDQSPSDLTTRVIYARVLLESSTALSAKVFAQTGVSAWGDGDEVYLVPGAWQCVSFDLQDPSVVTPGFDSTAVRTLGVFFFGDASARLYVDQISY